jgi:hypothetical protein
MTEVEITLDLPDRLAAEAKEFGLLSSQGIARLLREELQRRAARSGRSAGRSEASIVELLAGAPEVEEFDPPRMGSLGGPEA